MQYVSYRTFYQDSSIYNQWYEGPQMIYGRYGHSCVTTEFLNGTAIVVAGGYGEYNYQIFDSVEFLYLGTWRRGPRLPHAMARHSMVTFQNKVITVGGYDGTSSMSALFQMTCDDNYNPNEVVNYCFWSKMS